MNSKTRKPIKYALPYSPIALYSRYKVYKATSKLNYCPVCENSGKFLPMESIGGTRLKACCPNCGALERHRLMWLFINRKIGFDKLKNKSILHIAAETIIESKLRKIVGKKYLTADYIKNADVKMDITDINYKDSTFDGIICNHVLEHVSNDKKAMREMYRVLEPGGWAILLVPLADMPTTYEDTKITSEKGRLRAYGQIDHVRKYGRDYIDRLKNAGWNVNIYKAKDIATGSEIKHMSLIEDVKQWGFTSTNIFYCTKQEVL